MFVKVTAINIGIFFEMKEDCKVTCVEKHFQQIYLEVNIYLKYITHHLLLKLLLKIMKMW